MRLSSADCGLSTAPVSSAPDPLYLSPMTLKAVLGLHLAHRDDIADLVTRRPVPGPNIDQVDPFLFLNHHGPQTYGPNNRGLPFGPHPHRGFETVTFILEGELMHRDSGGHDSVIHAGGVQWMTAGSGLVHAEISPGEFKRVGGPMEILQLWVNLPRRLKMTAPAYTGLQRESIPAIAADDGRATVNLVSGTWAGRKGPVASLTGIFMATIEMRPGAKLAFDGLAGRTVFLYAVSGAPLVNGKPSAEHALVELDIAGDRLELVSADGARLLFGHGAPIGEPVFAYGPFVMNTEQDIRQAISDYQSGLFGHVEG
jgi:redox-sensitive bicupin YhaK (pirin superfamily)